MFVSKTAFVRPLQCRTKSLTHVVHGGAGLLASKLVWNYVDCMTAELLDCGRAGLIVCPIHPPVRIMQPFGSLVCFISRHRVLLDTQSVTLDWWSANMHLSAARRHRTTRTDITSLREIRTRDLSFHAASYQLPHWADEYCSNATTQTLRRPTASLLQLEFVMAIDSVVLDYLVLVECLNASYVVQNYGTE